MSAKTRAVLLLLCAGLAVAGCSSQDAAAPAATASQSSVPEPMATKDAVSANACSEAEAVLNSVSAAPDAAQATSMASRLDAIAAQAPQPIAGPVSALSKALVAAASTPDGFGDGSKTAKDFDDALQAMGQACMQSQL